MKIRNGFVSNSSSSSYVIIGTQVKLSSITQKDIKSKKYTLICRAGEGSEGESFAELTDMKMVDMIKKHEPSTTVYKAFFFSTEAYGDKIDGTKIPKGSKIWSGTMDQYMYSSVQDLIDYCYTDEYNDESNEEEDDDEQLFDEVDEDDEEDEK